MGQLNIIVADDHPLFRSGVIDAVSKMPNIRVVAHAENGMKAYQEIIALRPDIAILDIEMPILSGLDVAKKVLGEKHQTRIILLTMHKTKSFFQDAMQSGVQGYLLKDNAIEELLECIVSVDKGNTFVSPQFKGFLNNQHEALSEELQMVKTLLTPTEKVILKLISEGRTSAEIADLLFVSPNTVDNHRSNITKKLKLEGKNSLLKFSMRLQNEL
ncbi:MAG: response regulator transcription factor [Saprospiraceae bacterium]|nr:response regulator transcription factor [Saprospiraceae bacterium]